MLHQADANRQTALFMIKEGGQFPFSTPPPQTAAGNGQRPGEKKEEQKIFFAFRLKELVRTSKWRDFVGRGPKNSLCFIVVKALNHAVGNFLMH